MKGKLPCSSLAEFHDILCVSGFTIVHWTTQTEVSLRCVFIVLSGMHCFYTVATTATCSFVPIVH